MTSKWTAADMPRQTGRRVVITGANSGLGFETARALASASARVTMAVRDVSRGEQAAEQIRASHPDATIEVRQLDLADLASVRAFAAEQTDVDLLINNAGVMAIPRRQTIDGFEMQLGTNHLGHFALTGLLMPALASRPGSRVVNVSSNAHKFGKMNFDDLMGTRRYSAWGTYGQSKLANLLFTLELARRCDAADVGVLVTAAHPGYAATNLQYGASTMTGKTWQNRFIDIGNRLIAQSAEMGALPTLFAATAPGLQPAAYIGPDGILEQRGHPKIANPHPRARNYADAARLWEISEDLTGVRYPF